MMPRSDYINFRETDKNAPLLRELCQTWGLDPEAHGAKVECLNRALVLAHALQTGDLKLKPRQ